MKKRRTTAQILQRTRIPRSLADAAIFFFAMAMLGNGPAEAQTRMSDRKAHPEVECESRSTRVKAVTAPGDQSTAALFASTSEIVQIFSELPFVYPLLTTEVSVEGPGASCLIAHFSGEAEPLGNGIILQVRVDGVPMEGHFNPIFDVSIPAFIESFAPQGPGPGSRVMLAYNFFSRVPPGVHTIDILFAGCCSAPAQEDVIQARVSSPVLTLEYR